MRYASENTGTLSLRVNNVDSGDINFSGNGTWSGNYSNATANINIPAGATVEIINLGNGDIAANIDWVEFSHNVTPPVTDSTTGTTRIENNVVISEIAERYRVRHELSSANFHNFNIEYWIARFGFLTLEDYTLTAAEPQRQAACGTTTPCIVVNLRMPVGVSMVDFNGSEKNCIQQAPNFRFNKIYGDETGFLSPFAMDIVLDNGDAIPACTSFDGRPIASRAQRDAAQQWRFVMLPQSNTNRPFAAGEQVEFEITTTFDRAEISGDNVNYYGQTYRYVFGQGFTVNNQDPAVGPVGINDSFAKLGGDTTIPHLSNSTGDERRLSFMQHVYNMSHDNIASWLQGRRLFHTRFTDGTHNEQVLAGPQAANGNLAFPAMANKASNPIQADCVTCHFLNGNGELQSGQDIVPPKVIGLGLLEAIPNSTIEQWAEDNGGRISRVDVNGISEIGRFGWRAETATIRQQIAKALLNDMGIETAEFGFGSNRELATARLDELEVYTKLLAVPTPRQNLTQMPGHQRFIDFGCEACHKNTAQTGVDQNFPELSNQTIHPFTDLLLHDLGEGEFRTAPLWGIGLSGYIRDGNADNLNLMHDGNATSIDAAIQRHNGDAGNAKAAYNAATSQQRLSIVNYLMAM